MTNQTPGRVPTLTDADPAIPALPALPKEAMLKLIEEHLGLMPRRDDTVVDNNTGRWTDAARYYDLMTAAIAAAGRASRVQGEAVAQSDVDEARRLIYAATATDLLSGNRAVVNSDRGAVYQWLTKAGALLAGNDTAPQAETLAVADWKSAYEAEAAKFQQETCRTSELTALLRRWMARHEAEHGPGPWAKSCEVCALVGESEALLAKPINAAAPTPTASIAPKGEFGATAIGSTLQRVMGRLADMLDDDKFNEIEGIVNSGGFAAPKAEGEAVAGERQFYQHVKSGGVYELVCRAIDEANPEVSRVIYRSATGVLWDRIASEFDDGRFVHLATYRAAPVAQSAPLAKVDAQVAGGQIDQMVNRFLSWPIPKTFSPDRGISFDGRKDDEWNKNKTWPTGTNLLSGAEAKAMFTHALAAAAPVAQAAVGATQWDETEEQRAFEDLMLARWKNMDSPPVIKNGEYQHFNWQECWEIWIASSFRRTTPRPEATAVAPVAGEVKS